MNEIRHDFPIDADIDRVFETISTPAGLDEFWSLRSTGSPELGAIYELHFGEGYDWHATVTRYSPNEAIEFEISSADQDWNGTRIGFSLELRGSSTWVRFRHDGWPENNEHYRSSTFCWAMYLRVLRRHLEHGESVPYAERLDV